MSVLGQPRWQERQQGAAAAHPNSHQSTPKTSGSKLGCLHRGWLAMRSTAPTQAAGRAAGPPDRLCAGGRLPPPGPLGWHHLPGRGAAQAGPGQGVAGRGRVGRLERAPRATACPTGRLRAWTTMVLHQPTRPDATDCWSAGTAPLASWPSTAAARLARPRWRFWSRSPGGAGPSKSASRPARACAAWTSTRSAAGTPGPAG
jgi:hypothetical protein